MTKPATDEEIAEWTNEFGDAGFIVLDGKNFFSLIARIRQEQEDRKTVEDLIRSIRFYTIQECAEIVRTWAEDHKTVQSSFTGMTAAILALLEKKP